jgi:hypothetical protein
MQNSCNQLLVYGGAEPPSDCRLFRGTSHVDVDDLRAIIAARRSAIIDGSRSKI